jgi:hypothetical protein
MTIKNVPNVAQFRLRKMVGKMVFKDINALVVNIDLEAKREIN